MATKEARKKAARIKRKMRIRKKVHGSAECPRLVAIRSIKHISASLVDDDRGITMTGIIDHALKEDEYPLPEAGEKEETPVLTGKMAKAYRVGLAIAAAAKEQGIEKVVFDRNGLRYHGRVRAMAEGARKGGLEF